MYLEESLQVNGIIRTIELINKESIQLRLIDMLIASSTKENIDVFKSLLSYDTVSSKIGYILHTNCCIEAIEAIIEHGIILVDIPRSNNGRDVLESICGQRGYNRIKLLLDQGFTPETSPNALVIRASLLRNDMIQPKSLLEGVKLLVKKGWDVEHALRTIYRGSVVNHKPSLSPCIVYLDRVFINLQVVLLCDRIGSTYNTNAFVHLARNIASYL